MLTIAELRVERAGKTFLQHIDLEIKPGETHILFGPNGSGKTSLLMTIMGYQQYRVTHGKIVFKGVDITHAPIDERAKLGIGMSYQRPPTINGLKTRQMIEICAGGKVDVEGLAKSLNFESFLERDVNAGFSGGEIKRSELAQLLAQQPDLVLLDEPESGVDLVNISLIGHLINKLLQKKQPIRQRERSGLIITHTGHILEYVDARTGYVLLGGTIICEGDPHEILKTIVKKGYEECRKCVM